MSDKVILDVEHAVTIVANMVVASGDHLYPERAWEMYPEIGEADWHRVDRRVKEITEGLRPEKENYAAAYDYLTKRAETL